jgi:GntR family transcriptional regulator/MocR family aminotransferase
LQGLDSENLVICAGAFSKALFPSVRIGYLVVPRDLAEAFIACRVMVDLQPATSATRLYPAGGVGGLH